MFFANINKNRRIRICCIIAFLFMVPLGKCFSTGYNSHLPNPIVDDRVERIIWQVDPLGLIEYGPAISLELRIFQNTFITPHFRYYYGGLLYHARYTDFWKSSDVRVIPASMGLGVSIKSLLGNIQSPGRFYWGGYFEYGFGGYDEKDAGAFGDQLNREADIMVGGTFGHKWLFKSRRSLNLGGVAGVAYPTKLGYYLEDELGQPWHSPKTPAARFYLLVELQIGFPFGK